MAPQTLWLKLRGKEYREHFVEAHVKRCHGVRAVYQQGCRCLPCRAANTRYGQQRRPPRVDARPVRDYLRVLAGHQMGVRQVARLASLSPGRIQRLRAGTDGSCDICGEIAG